MKRIAAIVIAVFLLGRCGGTSSPFTGIKKPVSIAMSTEKVMFQGQQTQLAYVADEFNQSISVLDTRQEKIIDIYGGDDFDFTPIPVGGQPSAVAVDDGVTPHRIFVSDQLNNQILAYKISANAHPSDDFLPYVPVSLGGTLEGRSSRYLFRNSGSSSNPTITNLKVNKDFAHNEAWQLTSTGGSEYTVDGTVSGRQTKRAVEGTTYTSDHNEISFLIEGGGERTTEDDAFFFGTFVTRPHQLALSPVDLLIHARRLYILTKNVPSMIVYNLDTLAEETTIALPNAAAIPNRMSFHDNKIYVSNSASGEIYVFDTIGLAFTTITTSLTSTRYVAADDEHLFVTNGSEARLLIYNLTGTTLIKGLNLEDNGNSFIFKRIPGQSLGLIPNESGNVDVIDTSTLKRIDTDLDGKPDFINQQFFDAPPASNPQLISVSGQSGIVRDEKWQMVFKNGSYTLTGSKSGVQTNKVIPGESYTSDNGAIQLLTRKSFSQPETNGDFFSFETLDPIDPIIIGNQSLAVDCIAFNRISDDRPVSYVIQQTNGQVSIIDLIDLSLAKTL